ncbi:MAG: outer membrane protein transport protein [Deltaproteobacteria bacterium]|nr:MAG: outer membrane protein transport protein [Deltaproteobacteria bacterium]
MKKLITFLFAAGFIFSATSSLLAGGIDNKTNYSADYIRTLNRNAATESADAVVYNPAGVMQMEDGLYLKLDVQYTLIKEPANTIGGIELESDATDFVPGLFALYKRDKWAAFAAFNIPAGGGTVEFERGSATTFAIAQGLLALPVFSTVTNQYLEGESVYYGFTVGGAYAINDMISVSLGVRFVDAEKEAQGFVTVANPAPATSFFVDFEQSDDGWGGIVGVNISPTKELNIGLRYETKTSLDLEYKVNRDDVGLFTPGAVEKRDLPGLLGLGVAYTVTPKVKVEADLTYYLNEDVDWSDPKFSNRVDNGYDAGIALEYTFNSKLKGSVGYLFTESGLDPDAMLPEWPELDANSIAAGVAYEPTPALSLNFGLTKVFYSDETATVRMTPNVKLEKDVLLVAFGIQYKFK